MTTTATGRLGNFLGVALLVALSSTSVAADLPLHRRIDAIVVAGTVAPPVDKADDAEFLRRVFLDLAGTIPEAAEARAFLDDPDPGKRAKLVDSLLLRPEYSRHLAASFDVWMMERRADTHVKAPGWREFLTRSFAANKPYHQLVGEILAADGTEERNRDAARFYLDRLGDPDSITRDVGRMFFGMDLQCAQCHDHPNIPDYLQRDYYGLAAFFGRTYLFQPDKKKPAVLAEKAVGGGDFKSVFTDVEATLLPQVPESEVAFPDPEIEPGQEYEVAPDPKNKNLQPVPRYSRRELVAKAVTGSDNPAFNRNIANRLWAHMMGRGLVEPLDFHHASNPPSHPELLELLATEISRMNYDVRAFLREIALTETYQRRSEMSAELASQAKKVEPSLDTLEAEETRLREVSQAAAKAFELEREAWEAARKAATVPEAALAAAEKKRVAAAEALKKADDALAASRAELEKSTSTSEEGKPDPNREKLEAAVAAKQEAVDAAKTNLASASAEADKRKPSVEVEQEKVAAVTARLEEARRKYDADKTTWKLAWRKLEDAKELIEFAEAVDESRPVLETADRLAAELATVRGESEALRELAAALESAADSAQAARAQLPHDDDLVTAAAVLGDRSDAARAKATVAARALAGKQAEFDEAETAANRFREKRAATLESLTNRWADAFAVGAFTQLTPEQLCAAMLQATGEIDKYRAAGDADFTKKLAAQEAAKKKAADAKNANPDKKEEAKKEEAKKPAPPPVVLAEADREKHVRAYVDGKVDAMTKRFISLFGGQPGLPQGDFFATADQALFLSNDGTVRAWLRPSGENLSGRLLEMEDAEALAEELYLGILTRRPDDDEIASVRDYLAARGEKKSEAVQELGWALLSSVEFRFKH